MARIAGVDIPNDKTRSTLIDLCVWYRLPTSKKIWQLLNFRRCTCSSIYTRSRGCNRREVDATKLKVIFVEVNLNIKRLMETPWRSWIHRRGLPARTNTKNNARTQR